MQFDSLAQPYFLTAFQRIVGRIEESLRETPETALPVSMYIFGGGAVHFYTGDRVSIDIDATFSHRIALPDDLEVSYRAPDGAAKLLYFDRQFNDRFALVHEDAYSDSVPLELSEIDSKVLDIRLLSALDLAVSKISRLANHDRQDIAALARRRLINSNALRIRAKEAMEKYVGNLNRLQTSIDLACNIVATVGRQKDKLAK